MGIGAMRQYHEAAAAIEPPPSAYVTREEHEAELKRATREAGDPERIAALEKAAEAAHSKAAAMKAEAKEKDERIAALEKALAEVGVEIPDADELPLDGDEETEEGEEDPAGDGPAATDPANPNKRRSKKRRST